jgi:APA family basic amino acid/polyamine antiporter
LIVILTAMLGGLVPFGILGKLTSMGGIIDYICVTSVVLVLRLKMPNAPRPFHCPAVFLIAPIGLVACVYLLFKQIINIDGELMLTGKLIIGWIGSFIILYFLRYKSWQPISKQ